MHTSVISTHTVHEIQSTWHFTDGISPTANIWRKGKGDGPWSKSWIFVALSKSCACDEDHHRAVAAATCKPPSDWKRPPGRPNHRWLRAIESDLRPLNIGPSYVWKKAASREHWRSTVDTATLNRSMLSRERKKLEQCDRHFISIPAGKTSPAFLSIRIQGPNQHNTRVYHEW